MSLFAALSVASQALLANTIALNSTNKNINNVYTDGYVREEPVFADFPGLGVEVKELNRVFSSAIYSQLIKANWENEYYSERSSILEQIESVFNDAQGSGFSNEIEEFFNALNDVAVNPDDIAARESFLSAAQTLVGRIRQSYSALEEIKATSTTQLRDSVNRLNELLKELADINRFLPGLKDSPTYNQYLDQRDQLLKEISSLIEVKFVIRDDNTVDVYTTKGFALVLRDRAFDVDVENTPDGLELKVSGVNIAEELKGGQIGGLIAGINEVNEWEERLNQFTSVFAEKINAQHEAGYDLYANTGNALFTSDNGQPIDASNISLAFEDPKMVAAAASSENLNADNENAKALIALSDEKFGELGNLSFAEFYGSEIVGAIGSRVSSVKNLYENSSFRLSSIEDKFQEISGVNMDEELLKLTKFQRAYEAATKIVNVSDELLQTVLNMVG